MFLPCMHRLSMHRLIQSLTQFIDTILIPFYPVRESSPYRGFLGSLCLCKNRKCSDLCFKQFLSPAFIVNYVQISAVSSFQGDISDINPSLLLNIPKQGFNRFLYNLKLKSRGHTPQVVF